VIGGVLGVVDALGGSRQTTEFVNGRIIVHDQPVVSVWVWIPHLVGGLFIAQFWAWREAAKKVEDLEQIPVSANHASELKQAAQRLIPCINESRLLDYGGGDWKDAFRAHLPSLVEPLDDWDRLVEVAWDARNALDSRFQEELTKDGLAETTHGLIDVIRERVVDRVRRSQADLPFNWNVFQDGDKYVLSVGGPPISQGIATCDSPEGAAQLQEQIEVLTKGAHSWSEVGALILAENAVTTQRAHLLGELGTVGVRATFYGRCPLCSPIPQ
jgi:hypothetical protein